MARPKKDEALGASAFIGLRVPPALRDALERKAAANRTNIAVEARHALERGLEADRKQRRK
jgi:hypothetical protein